MKKDTIDLKYCVGDWVWFMLENKPVCRQIVKIDISCGWGEPDSIGGDCHEKPIHDGSAPYSCTYFYMDYLFKDFGCASRVFEFSKYSHHRVRNLNAHKFSLHKIEGEFFSTKQELQDSLFR